MITGELCYLWFLVGPNHAGLLQFYYIEMVLKVHAKINFRIKKVKFYGNQTGKLISNCLVKVPLTIVCSDCTCANPQGCSNTEQGSLKVASRLLLTA